MKRLTAKKRIILENKIKSRLLSSEELIELVPIERLFEIPDDLILIVIDQIQDENYLSIIAN